MSLKDQLYKLIKEKGVLTYGDMCQFVSEQGFKISNAERRLREMEGIEPIMAKSTRGTMYIKAYKLIGPVITSTAPKGLSFVYKVHYPVTNFKDPA